MSELRTDPKQWLIYEKGPVTAVTKALEVLALGVAGTLLARHPNLQVRGLGNVMLKMATARKRTMMGLVKDVEPDDFDRRAAAHLEQISAYLGGEGPEPVEALDEFHASVFWLDSKTNSAGLSGPGWFRELVRGEHGR